MNEKINKEMFKNYIIFCEYLKIDPRKQYEMSLIEERYLIVLNKLDSKNKKDKPAIKLVKDVKTNYQKITEPNSKYLSKCNKLVTKGKMTLNESTISDNFEFKQLTQKNYDSYLKVQQDRAFIGLVVLFGFIVVLVILLIIFSIIGS